MRGAAREHILKGVKGEYWPTISLVGEYDVLEESNNFKQYFNPHAPFQRNEVAVGIQLSIPIFSAKRARYCSGEERIERRRTDFLGTKRQQLSLDVQQKSRNVREVGRRPRSGAPGFAAGTGKRSAGAGKVRPGQCHAAGDRAGAPR